MDPLGLSPLRGTTAQHIYGLPGISKADKDKARLGTLFQLRAAEASLISDDVGIPWLNEQPKQYEGTPHSYMLPEWVQLLSRSHVIRHTLQITLWI